MNKVGRTWDHFLFLSLLKTEDVPPPQESESPASSGRFESIKRSKGLGGSNSNPQQTVSLSSTDILSKETRGLNTMTEYSRKILYYLG